MKTLSFANGDTMPALGLGTWKSSPGEVKKAVLTAIDLGYRHIDCAPIYGNEHEVGAAFVESFAASTVDRKDLWVTSKLWNNAHAAEDVRPALEKTLADLKLDYLDLFLIHWPVHIVAGATFAKDASEWIAFEDLPIESTWKAMEAAQQDGLVRHIGVSNFSIRKLQILLDKGTMKPEVNQIELHPYLQQSEMLSFCADHQIHLTAYSPLGSADRPSQLKKEGEPVLLEDPIITDIARSHSASPAQVLLAWALERNTSVIPKSVNPQRLEENLKAAQLVLSAQEMSAIGALDRRRRYVSGDFWTTGDSPYTIEGLWDE